MCLARIVPSEKKVSNAELDRVQQAPRELNFGEFASKRRRPTKGRHFGKLLRHYSDMPNLHGVL